MADDLEPGRPAVEAVFVAFIATTMAGVVAVLAIAALVLPAGPAGSPPTAISLSRAVLLVSLSFAAAQAVLPGPKSAGCFGLAIPLAGAVVLAYRGLSPSAVVSALLVGVCLTPAAYFLAVRLSFPLGGLLGRRPVSTVAAAAAAILILLEIVRRLAVLADLAARSAWP